MSNKFNKYKNRSLANRRGKGQGKGRERVGAGEGQNRNEAGFVTRKGRAETETGLGQGQVSSSFFRKTYLYLLPPLGCTPLIIATQYGKTGLVGYLIGKGARKDFTDIDGDNALHWAAFKGNLVNKHWAALKGRNECCKQVLGCLQR